MSHRVHAALAVVLELGGFLGGAVGAWWLAGPPVGPEGLDPRALATLVAALLGGVLVPRAAWRRLVHARCPACGAVAARLEGRHPWVYRCGSCGHLHETAISDGSSTSEPSDDD